MAPTTDAAGTERARGVIEVVTAILLGLVSVATAFGAYQAGMWAQEANALASASQQLRDRNLSLFLESEIISGDDSQKLFDALALSAEAAFYPERTEALMAEQELVLASASPAMAEAWDDWVDSGYAADRIPAASPAYQAMTFAPSQSYNLISAVAYRASEALEDRSYIMTIVSVVFAFALLLLGISGAGTRLDVSAITTGGGAAAFLAGVAMVVFLIF
ncbi:MAG TPA: hypothetical protein VNR36_09280 [Pseudolysinimonas sp.]|nr:hypothetical protein [Pseudolysinimonas sp.]